MKRLIYIISTIIIVAACSKDFESDTAGGSVDKCPIKFSTWVEATRATEADNTDLQGYGFEVSAYLDEDNSLHYFDGTVTYDDGWSCDNPQYWPSSGSITFDAYGYDDAITGYTLTKNNDRTLSYICDKEPDNQIDLLGVSQEIANKQIANLGFNHLLSQINFTVDFDDTEESNVSLDKINLYYHNIKNEGTYSFESGTWTLGTSTFGDSYATTSLSSTAGKLMIIPQPVNLSEEVKAEGNYISLSLEYTLNTAPGENIEVTTGIMELPAPTESANEYKQGMAYTYNIKVNGEKVSIGLDIADANKPSYAYGNIDLRLITAGITQSEYEKKRPVTKADGVPYLYYSTAVRVAELMADGVRDFVVVGDFGAGNGTADEGKLGYSGYTSSPFFIAAEDLGMMPKYKDSKDKYDNSSFASNQTFHPKVKKAAQVFLYFSENEYISSR